MDIDAIAASLTDTSDELRARYRALAVKHDEVRMVRVEDGFAVYSNGKSVL